MRARTAIALAAAVPAAAAAAAAALKAGHWKLHYSRHGIWLQPKPRPRCSECHGVGGWWTGGPNPEMDSCWCWSDRRELHIRLLPRPPIPEAPPF